MGPLKSMSRPGMSKNTHSMENTMPLDKHDAHVKADAQLHKHQSHKARDGGEAGGGDLYNSLAQSGDVRLPGVQTVVPLLHVPVDRK